MPSPPSARIYKKSAGAAPNGKDTAPGLQLTEYLTTASQTSTAKWAHLLIVMLTLLALLTFVGAAIRLGLVIHHTILLFSLGGLVAYALDPLVEWLRHPLRRKRSGGEIEDNGKGLSRKASVAIVFVGLLLLIGFGVWALGGRLDKEVRFIQHDYPKYQERAMALAAKADQALAARHVRFSLTETLRHPPAEVTETASRVGREALPFLTHTFSGLGESIIVLLIALYFLLFGTEMKEKVNAMLPPGLHSHAVPWEGDVNRILGGFVRGQLVIALIMGAATALGCFAIGIHLWLIIGLFVVVAALIPVFGPYLGAVPAVIAALIGPTHFHSPAVAAAVVLALFVVVNEVGSKVLYPKLVGSALGLHEVFVLFVLFAGLEIDGIVGVLFAAPVAALVIVTVIHLFRFWQGLPEGLLASVAEDASDTAKRQALS